MRRCICQERTLDNDMISLTFSMALFFVINWKVVVLKGTNDAQIVKEDNLHLKLVFILLDGK